MTVSEFISQQPAERQKLLSGIHEIIIREDKKVKAEIGSMMRNEMIIYNATGIFKYGLSSVKNHMSLHVLPIYGSPKLHSKYKELLPNANFQKGCINFKNAEEMPLKIINQLIHDCSAVDLLAIRENYLKSKAKKNLN
jgi:glycine/serine hydroxymethyltransferase